MRKVILVLSMLFINSYCLASETMQCAESQDCSDEVDDQPLQCYNAYNSKVTEEILQKFITDLKAAVLECNHEKLFKFLHEKSKAYINNCAVQLTTQEIFERHLHQIFSPRVLDAILNADIHQVFINYQGIMFGNGEIWINVSDRAYKNETYNADDLKIVTFNT